MKHKITFYINLKDKKYEDECLVTTMKLDFIPSIGQTFHIDFFSNNIIKDLFRGKSKGTINYKFVQMMLIYSDNFLDVRENNIDQLNYNKKEKFLTEQEENDIKSELDFWDKAYELYSYGGGDDLVVKKVHIHENEIWVDLEEEY